MTSTRFHLDRRTDESGVSGVGRVAEGVRFSDGRAALRWLTATASTAAYDSMADLVAIHGHGGKTLVAWDDERPEAFAHGAQCCGLDACENAPFATVGGLAARAALRAPDFAVAKGEAYARDFLDGYAFAAVQAYGADWRTCSFGWAPALTIPAS